MVAVGDKMRSERLVATTLLIYKSPELVVFRLSATIGAIHIAVSKIRFEYVSCPSWCSGCMDVYAHIHAWIKSDASTLNRQA